MKIIITSGKRKNAIARARLNEGNGTIRINSLLINNFQPVMLREKIMEPIKLAGDVADSVNISIKTNGGGVASQAEAARLAIGRALTKYNNKLEKVFLNYDRQLLVADVRRKEVCKPNDSKARAKRQKSYR
ncbi:30S ribosomal protein S9 [Candidatus Woesearchaeota archaeon]|nr:30S ribosomal protein S9 [Candidatus Woesearchaeota archaeon]